MFQRGEQTHLVFKIPSRGTMGLRTKLLNVSHGEATMFHHFSEYGILAGLILILLFTFEEVRNTRKHIIMGAVVTDLICMIYASTDEFHQTFVDGRSGKSTDVLIDTSGTVFATIILCLIIVCAGNRRRKNEQLER
jgi:VanZ family protein